MNEKEAGILRTVLENCTADLDVEIHRTENWDFRKALEEREKVVHRLVTRLEKGP
jgi:hypothetical protein